MGKKEKEKKEEEEICFAFLFFSFFHQWPRKKNHAFDEVSKHKRRWINAAGLLQKHLAARDDKHSVTSPLSSFWSKRQADGVSGDGAWVPGLMMRDLTAGDRSHCLCLAVESARFGYFGMKRFASFHRKKSDTSRRTRCSINTADQKCNNQLWAVKAPCCFLSVELQFNCCFQSIHSLIYTYILSASLFGGATLSLTLSGGSKHDMILECVHFITVLMCVIDIVIQWLLNNSCKQT